LLIAFRYTPLTPTTAPHPYAWAKQQQSILEIPALRQIEMAVEVTLTLPENLVEHAKRLGDATQRDVAAILADALEMLLPTWENLPEASSYPTVSSLSDAEVLALADSKMDAVQNQRLGELQQRGKTTGLTEAESYELLALMQIYQLGQLRKSEALAEAVRRGLRSPLSP
jgi:hypothetical protein